MKNVRVAKELATTGTHSGHAVLNEKGKSGLLGSAGLHLVPNGGDLFISGYTTNKTQGLKLQQGEITWEGCNDSDRRGYSTGCNHGFLSGSNSGFDNSSDVLPPWVDGTPYSSSGLMRSSSSDIS